MTSYYNFPIVYTYYYKYKEERNQIRSLVENNDISGAQIRLNSIITEHDNYMSGNLIPFDFSTFTGMDDGALKHAKTHMPFAEATTSQKQSVIDALNEEYD